MKAFLVLFVTTVFFVAMLFFYVFLYDFIMEAFGGLFTFLIIIGLLYLYAKLISIIDASKKMR
jgi:hypothetical protein